LLGNRKYYNKPHPACQFWLYSDNHHMYTL